jgi:hypothetical protein
VIVESRGLAVVPQVGAADAGGAAMVTNPAASATTPTIDTATRAYHL